MKSLLLLLVGLLAISSTQASGIPMWEFLSRGEKVSRLFHVFMRQVDDYCNTSDMPDCNKAMMVHGLSSLARMEDDHLDAMDPYQRDAHELIWDAMMHEQHKQQPAESSASDAANGSNQLPSNLKESASNVDVVYARPNGDKPSTPAAVDSSEHHSQEAVGGPMVFRVLPDGRPVPGDPPRQMPADLDMIEYRMMNTMPHHHPAVSAYRSPRQLKYPFSIS